MDLHNFKCILSQLLLRSADSDRQLADQSIFSNNYLEKYLASNKVADGSYEEKKQLSIPKRFKVSPILTSMLDGEDLNIGLNLGKFCLSSVEKGLKIAIFTFKLSPQMFQSWRT